MLMRVKRSGSTPCFPAFFFRLTMCVCACVCGRGGIEIQKGCDLHYAGRNRFKSGRQNAARSASAQKASSKLKSSGDGSRGVHQGLGKHFLRC